MDLQLKGKRALVTGGSKGIGKAVARALLLEGADVALLARHEQTLLDAVSELAMQTGGDVIAVVADTTDDEQVRQAVATAARQLGGSIDILVNAAAEPAGYAAPPKLEEIAAEAFHREMDTKVMGYVRCAREVVPGHARRRLGPHRQHQRPGRAPDRQRRRLDAQHRGGRAHQEHGRRAGARRHPGDRGASRA